MSQLLYKGKAKQLFSTDKEDCLRMKFLDDVSAFNGRKKSTLAGKAYLNKKINSSLMQWLYDKNIDTHHIKDISADECLVKKMRMLPLECIVRNVTAGSLCKRLGIEKGQILTKPVVEYYLKNDELDDPWLNSEHITMLKIATTKDLERIRQQSLLINSALQELFNHLNWLFVDLKLEFGFYKGQIILGDELSPDNFRLWNKDTLQSIDKDLFRQDKGDLLAAYRYIATELEKVIKVNNEQIATS